MTDINWQEEIANVLNSVCNNVDGTTDKYLAKAWSDYLYGVIETQIVKERKDERQMILEKIKERQEIYNPDNDRGFGSIYENKSIIELISNLPALGTAN